MVEIRIRIEEIRPSGHKMKVYDATFGCKNAGNHKRDFLEFLQLLETECPDCMPMPKQVTLE